MDEQKHQLNRELERTRNTMIVIDITDEVNDPNQGLIMLKCKMA